MWIVGPGRDVRIKGVLKPGFRTGGPFTMVRECDTMVAQIRQDERCAVANLCEVQGTQEFDAVLDEEAAERAEEASGEAAMGTPGTPGTPPSPTILDNAAADANPRIPQSWEESRRTSEAWTKDLKRSASEAGIRSW